MIWFRPCTFDFPAGTQDPARRLVAALDKRGLHHSLSASRIKVSRSNGAFFRNSWNPVFVGRIVDDGSRAQLKGHFRVHLYTLLFTALFVGAMLLQLWNALAPSGWQSDPVPGWEARRIKSALEFIAAFSAITLVGWLCGLPNARHILAAIREGTTGDAGSPPA
jgi:hypothetical protein